MNDPIRKQLQNLADVEPSDALWTKLSGARQQQLRRQRGWIAGGTAACAVFAATLFFTMDPRFADDASAPASTRVTTSTPSASATSVTPPEPLHHIDRELQLAYARNADDAELASLWAVRQDILHARPETVQPLGI